MWASRPGSCGAKAVLVVAAVDPAIGQPELVGRRMVVEHAFGGMQDVTLFDPLTRQHLKHIVEIAIGGFIAADILSGINTIKCTPRRVFAPENVRLSVLVRTTSLKCFLR